MNGPVVNRKRFSVIGKDNREEEEEEQQQQWQQLEEQQPRDQFTNASRNYYSVEFFFIQIWECNYWDSGNFRVLFLTSP